MIRKAWAFNRIRMLGVAVFTQVPADVWLWAGGELEFRPTVARYVALACGAAVVILQGRKPAA